MPALTIESYVPHNCRDFEALHEEDPHHPGILVIYENKDYSKDMSRGAIVKAIANKDSR